MYKVQKLVLACRESRFLIRIFLNCALKCSGQFSSTGSKFGRDYARAQSLYCSFFVFDTKKQKERRIRRQQLRLGRFFESSRWQSSICFLEHPRQTMICFGGNVSPTSQFREFWFRLVLALAVSLGPPVLIALWSQRPRPAILFGNGCHFLGHQKLPSLRETHLSICLDCWY